MRANDSDIVKNKLYLEAEPFLSAHPDYDLTTLPSWVAENIEDARVYGNSKKGIILPDGRKYHLDNHLNDMTGREWTFFINSVFCTHYPTSGKEAYAHHIRKIHPTPKPPQLMRDLIQFFTKENELVFDHFMGVGGTLLGAALCNRVSAGIDLNQDYINAYHDAAKELSLADYSTECGDCLSVLKDNSKMHSLTNGKQISLLLFDPPYSNMMSKEKTGADIAVYGKNATPFSSSEYDLGNMERPLFLTKLRESVELALPYIKFRGYIVLFIKDLQPSKKEPNLLHAEVINELNKIPNIFYKGMKIWADESTKLYPYGYPFSFVANQIHQYILVFRKEK
ncbi:MAG: DNA methyltransferase [Anaerovoracaceae bacterium]|jgi:tRNA G10  N-methylase Trm11